MIKSKKASVNNKFTGHFFPSGKKAMILVLYTAILIMLVIMPMLFVKMDAKKSQFTKTLGKIQIDLLQTYQDAQKDMFYIDQSAKYAAYESIFDLAENGGFTALGSKCRDYLRYNVWKKGCYPDYKKNFNAYFSLNLNPYLSAAEIKQIDYNLFLEKDKIIGTAVNNLFYEFDNGNYSVNPSFSLSIGYDVDDYLELRSDAEKLIIQCKDKPSINQCVEENKPSSWILGSCEGDLTTDGINFRFCVKAGYYPVYVGDTIANKQLIYKFALSFK